MKGIFLGCTKFSEELLKTIIEIDNLTIQAIFTIPKKFRISYSESEVENTNYADLSIYAEKLKVPYYEVNSIDGQRITDYRLIIEELKPDVILVLGWYYMVPKTIREIAQFGAWGIHASLLPKYAGGAPLVWAIINGEKETGVSLFKLDEGVDDGDIIGQLSFSIEENDTIKEVYHKASVVSKKLLYENLSGNKNVTFTTQDKTLIEVWPQRKPADGEINWDWSTDRIRNFIRAQSKPYPGAWTTINGKKVTIWDADIIDRK